MTSDTNTQRFPQWMPTAGGVLSIVAGSAGLILSVFLLVFGNIIGSSVLRDFFPSTAWQHWGWPFVIVGIFSLFSIVIDIIAIMGGIFAIQRKHWGWALAGGICAIIASRALGIVGLVFVALSRKDFK
jgi:hypothetical protein